MRTGTARPLIFAHRGASAYAPENTLAAFQLALEQGADGIELDAKLTSDGEVVVIHDQTVNRTTNGRGRVGQMTLDQLRQLDAGFWKGIAFKGQNIPTLAEVFETVGNKLIINIELTNYDSPDDGLPDKVAFLIRKFHLEECVLYSSFLSANLTAIRKSLPRVPLAILAKPGPAGNKNRSPHSRGSAPDYLHPHFLDVTRQLVDRERAAGRQVTAWT
ncbi:glycerophosphodiester phosphodiesterase, partial [bacterium]|nr:glycerophosphodiester phosphodiesterase [bacterium]